MKIDGKTRFKTRLELSGDGRTATLSYVFRGLDEARAFQNFVEQSLSNAIAFKERSDEMERICTENGCTDF